MKTVIAICIFALTHFVVEADDLLEIVERGSPSEVREAIDAGADVNATSGWIGSVYGMTPLMLAIERNENREVTEVLIEAGADVNAQAEHGERTPLISAIRYRESPTEILELLLEAGAEVTDSDWRAIARNRELRGTNIYWEMYDRWEGSAVEAFSRLVQEGPPDQVKEVTEAGIDVNSQDQDGRTLLMHAAERNGNPEVSELLLDAGAEVNARDNDGATPLIHASIGNHNPEVFEVLIEAGADVNAQDNEGRTPVIIAAGNTAIYLGSDALPPAYPMLEVLIDAGADVNARDDDGRTPLLRAAREQRSPEILELLLEAGAEVTDRVWQTLQRNDSLFDTDVYWEIHDRYHEWTFFRIDASMET